MKLDQIVDRKTSKKSKQEIRFIQQDHHDFEEPHLENIVSEKSEDIYSAHQEELFNSQPPKKPQAPYPRKPWTQRSSYSSPYQKSQPASKTPGEILFEERLSKERETYVPPETYTDLYLQSELKSGRSSQEILGIDMKDARFEEAMEKARPKWKLPDDKKL